MPSPSLVRAYHKGKDMKKALVLLVALSIPLNASADALWDYVEYKKKFIPEYHHTIFLEAASQLEAREPAAITFMTQDLKERLYYIFEAKKRDWSFRSQAYDYLRNSDPKDY